MLFEYFARLNHVSVDVNETWHPHEFLPSSANDKIDRF